MLVSGGLILWVLILYIVLAVLSGVLVLAIAWCGYRAVHALRLQLPSRVVSNAALIATAHPCAGAPQL